MIIGYLALILYYVKNYVFNIYQVISPIVMLKTNSTLKF
jgi:hypothetical protein